MVNVSFLMVNVSFLMVNVSFLMVNVSFLMVNVFHCQFFLPQRTQRFSQSSQGQDFMRL